MSVTARTSVTERELELIRDAFHEGRFDGLLQENEGMTRTLIFERPDGHIGLSIGTMPGDGDIHLSVSEWEKEPHHELDEWFWVRSVDTDTDRSEEADNAE